MPGGQVVVRMAGEEVAVHDAASGPSRPINYDPDHYGQALEGKRGLADADIAEAARANLALLDCVSSRGFEQKEHRKLSSLSIGSAHAF